VTRLSLQAPALHAAGARVLSTAAMTGLHALERPQPTRPMGPGRVARRAFESLRHGPRPRMAHVAVARGRVIAPSLGPTRTAADVVAPLARTVASDPAATRWHWVTETLHLHPSKSRVRFVATDDRITDDLGHKEQRGMLKSMATRAALLSEPTPRMVFHSTPPHAAWMHQIARWWSIRVRQWRKRASGTAVEALHTPVLACIA
jgi:hypothetical protein